MTLVYFFSPKLVEVLSLVLIWTWKDQPVLFIDICYLWFKYLGYTTVQYQGGPKQILFFKKNMKYVSFMKYQRPMLILESLKYPQRLCTIDLNFTKNFTRKYKKNIGILLFVWDIQMICSCGMILKPLKSHCLIWRWDQGWVEIQLELSWGWVDLRLN